MSGKLLIFSAPSGSGKTTIVKHLLRRNFNLEFSISATNRSKRANEKHGRDYYFLTTEEFQKKIENNEFLEWEELYKGYFYGTLKSEVERIRKAGKNVIFDVDVIGGLNIKEYYGDEALAVYIQPPSIEVLEARLRKRSADSNEMIAQRVAKADYEMSFANKFDKIIINNVLEEAFTDAEKALEAFLNQ